jgi:CDP-glucose 4,6-dehydratase
MTALTVHTPRQLNAYPTQAAGPSPSFWRGQRVLVTGHTGFKGSWLCTWLHLLGAQVHGLALKPEPNGHYERASTADLLTTDTRADIRSQEAVLQAIDTCQPDLVLHLAAQALVRPGYDDPLGTFNTNALGTAHVLQACRHAHKLKSVVIVTTDKCYRNEGQPWPYRETDALGGSDPYSASKACAELIASSFRTSFFNSPSSARIATARAGNVIGGGDVCRDRLLPDLFRSIDRSEALQLRYPQAVRPWQHVLDALGGYLVLAQALAQSEAQGVAYNFGPSNDSCWSVGEVVDRARSAWGLSASVEQTAQDPSRAESIALRLDSSLAHQDLGWQPLLDTEEAIAWTVEWERAVRKGISAQQITFSQIERLMTAPGACHAA